MKWELIMFDCDGVLVDSEPIANRIFAEMLTDIGLPMSDKETVRQFVGRSMVSCMEIIEQSLGRAVPDGFVNALEERTFAAFAQELRLVPGITEALASYFPSHLCGFEWYSHQDADNAWFNSFVTKIQGAL